MKQIATSAAAAAFDMKKSAIIVSKPKNIDGLGSGGVGATQDEGYSHILAGGRGIIPVVSEQRVKAWVGPVPTGISRRGASVLILVLSVAAAASSGAVPSELRR